MKTSFAIRASLGAALGFTAPMARAVAMNAASLAAPKLLAPIRFPVSGAMPAPAVAALPAVSFAPSVLLQAPALDAAAASPAPAPASRVLSEAPENSGSDPDRLAPEEEARLLDQAVADTYPQLSPELQAISRQVVFKVNHSWTSITKKFMGWSAEDDPEYRYPDTRFFPEGTIKTNFTEKFVRVLAFAESIKEIDPKAYEGARAFWREVIGHELEHARQYHADPVIALSSVKDSVKDGLADPEVLAGTRRKIEYERLAELVGRGFRRGHAEEMLALADVIEAHAKDEPALFAPGGPWHLLSPALPNSVSGRYLREDSKDNDSGTDFSESWKIIYEGQYRPAEIVRALKTINDGLQTARLLAGEADVAGTARAVAEMEAEWKFFMDSPLGKSNKQDPDFAYNNDVEQRYEREMARFRELASSR